MIRDVIVHLLSEQPVLVDLFDMPTGRDNGLVCQNLRSLDGRKPIFVERSDSTFFFPYQHIRFIEILKDRQAGSSPDPDAAEPQPTAQPAPDEQLEIDEDFLRRIREV
ncbi:MAG: hypothetical protein ABIQ17_07645 [Candidatus Limnocylindrales bacterium]